MMIFSCKMIVATVGESASSILSVEPMVLPSVPRDVGGVGVEVVR